MMDLLKSSTLRKHSITLAGHRTSVTLEDVFWVALKEIAAERGQTLSGLVEAIDAGRTSGLSSALRVYVVRYLMHSLDATKRMP